MRNQLSPFQTAHQRHLPHGRAERAAWTTGLVAVALVGMGACSSGKGAPSPPPLQATLSAVPDGSIQLVDLSHGQASVKLVAFGLPPDTHATVELHEGSCVEPSTAALVTFPAVPVDKGGKVNETLKASEHVPSELPPRAYLGVAVSPSTGSGPYEPMPVGCTDLEADRPTIAEALFPLPGERPGGKVTLTFLPGGKVTAQLSILGAKHLSVHSSEVHSGSCRDQGPVLFATGEINVGNGAEETPTLTVKYKKDAALAAGSSYFVVSSGHGDGPDRPLLCGDLTKP